MGRAEESAKMFELALKHPSASVIQIHQAGRQLLTDGKKAEALRVFEMNHQRNGDAWPVHVGLARAYLATGDNTKALDHAKKALAQAPDPVNKTNLANMVKALEEGKPFTN